MTDLRKMVLELNPDEIGLTHESFPYEVWGMLMETGLENGSYTLVSLADGTTSLYFSTGGGIIGAGEHKPVRDAALSYLNNAQYFFEKATLVTEYPPPKNGEVNFYFLTRGGVRLYTAHEDSLGNNKDALSGLFHDSHRVITEIRITSQLNKN